MASHLREEVSSGTSHTHAALTQMSEKRPSKVRHGHDGSHPQTRVFID